MHLVSVVAGAMLSRYVVSQVKHNSYFLVGLALGLWVSLAVIPLDEEPAAPCTSALLAAPTPDEFEPHREERPLGPGGHTAGRSVQRPRYYSTELGMRGSLLTGVLSSEEAIKSQIAALNKTTARLQPALKFFITASAMSSVPGLANVVGFTDTREMLKPFHALKYLADNYLEEYDFFYLVSDTAYVNARRLTELVSQLSVSQDVYMGTVADDDSHYCSLDGGILLSNSVLRAIHTELDWCVRNSYSPHHHENIGRCVLHAAKRACTTKLQGETYVSVRAEGVDTTLSEALAEAVSVQGVTGAAQLYALHAYVSRVHLQRDRAALWGLRAQLWRAAARHPPGYRNATWPGGLREDPGLAPPGPDTRFDHLRWVAFNASHAFFSDDHHEIARIEGAHRAALDLVVQTVRSWALRRWADALDVQLLEGAYRWEPARALRYRLLLRLRAGEGHTLRLVEVVRPLGAARLVPMRYVTESARLTLLLPVPATSTHVADALAFLQRYETVCLGQDKNTALVLVIVSDGNDTAPGETLRAAVSELSARHAGASLVVLEASAALGAAPEYEVLRRAQAAGAREALAHVPRDALVLQMVPHAEFSQDFLNRVRMNTIAGAQWYLPLAFARYSLYDNPRFVAPGGGKPTTNTGRFNPAATLVASFYRADYEAAAATWRGPLSAPAPSVLAHSALHCVRAPEPGLVLAPRPAPCAAPTEPPATPQCASQLREERFATLDLGARHSLAQLLLEHEADTQP